MNSIATFLKKSSLKIKIAAMMLLILIVSIWFALNSQPVQSAKHSSDVIVIRRESIEILEGRTILVNMPRMKGGNYTLVLEV